VATSLAAAQDRLFRRSVQPRSATHPADDGFADRGASITHDAVLLTTG